MIIEFASEVSNLAWRVSQSQNGGAIFARTKWSPMFGSVVFDYQWCILIVMSVKSSFYNEYDIKNNEKPVFWAQRSFQNHHQTFHDRCPEKIGPLPKKSDRWSTRTCPENIRPAPTWSRVLCQVTVLRQLDAGLGTVRLQAIYREPCVSTKFKCKLLIFYVSYSCVMKRHVDLFPSVKLMFYANYFSNSIHEIDNSIAFLYVLCASFFTSSFLLFQP